MAGEIKAVTGNLASMQLDLKIKFGDMIRKAIVNDPILSFAMPNSMVSINEGSYMFPKVGADEDILDINAVSDEYSNAQKWIKINVNQGYKTKPTLISSTAYAQLGYASINDMQLNAKKDKLLKFKVEKLIYNLLHPIADFTDGPVQTVDVASTDLDSGEKIYKYLSNLIIEKIRTGVKDAKGNNLVDNYRTGLETSSMRIAITPELALIFREYYATLDHNSSSLQNGAIGQILGVNIFSSIYLPFNDRTFAKGTGNLTDPSTFGNKDKITQTEGTKNYQIMFYTQNSFVSFGALGEIYDTTLRQHTAREVGFMFIDGAGSIWSDEIVMVNVTTTTP